MDGAVDYRGYSKQGLVEALQTIDRASFPQNFANLKAELDRRQISELPEASPPPTVAREVVWPIEPATGMTSTSISLWKYVALFALVFYVGAIVLGSLVEYLELKRASSLGRGLIFAAALIVGNRFVTQQRRLFYGREAHRLMLYCLLVILPLDAIALIGNPELLEKLSGRVALFALPVTVALNALSVWIAFRFFARRTMLRKLDKLTANAT